MNKRILISIISVSFLILGCEKAKLEKSEDEIKIIPSLKVELDDSYSVDIKSPDNALKSWWKFLDSELKFKYQLCQQNYPVAKDKKEEINKHIKKMTNGLMLQEYAPEPSECELATYSREIIEVKSESETRATVIAVIKNTTTPEANAKQEFSDMQRRQNGVKFKYILEKDSEGWKITQVYEDSELLKIINLPGKDTWQPRYIARESKGPNLPSYVLTF